MIEWTSLGDAYGHADRVPDLLEAVSSSDSNESDSWDELWGRLCHQGTVYSASYAALPALADISRRHGPSGYAAAARNLHYAKDDIEFAYGLQALMAFEDGGPWQRNLECLADGEATFPSRLVGRTS